MGKKRRTPRTYVLGDLHGAYKALDDLIRRVNFDYEYDTLVFLGDLADGWGEFDKCLDLFSRMQNFVPLIGNHDLYLMDFLDRGTPKDDWLKRGGLVTLDVIEKNPNVVRKLDDYFSKAKYYHIENQKIFCHGGFNHKRTIVGQRKLNFAINRQLYKIARKYDKQKLKFEIKYDDDDSVPIKEVFIGHSTTKKFRPDFCSNLTNIDTGAGSVGFLTIMDADRKKYIQSKNLVKLYKRNREH